MSASVARARVLAGFRRLNKARAQLFLGDDNAMQVSRQQMRAEFEKNKYITTAGPEFEALVAGIDEAADMLRNEILRGNLNQETGRYGRYTNNNRYNFRYSFSLSFSNAPMSFFIN
jgi:hypothetical protein